MHSSSVAALAAIVATAFAAPNSTVGTPTGFSVQQASAGQVYLNGPEQVARTFAKFNRHPPTNILAAAKSVQSGNVTATPEQYDESYLCPVDVGGKTLMLDFDTGSSDL